MDKTSYFITIIIPVYNEQKQLRKTLNSVVCQSIFDKLQVICVDDNSTDKSLTILNEYKQKHNNINVIESNNNVGYLCNLKRAIPFIKSKYVSILNVNRYVERTIYEELYNEIENIRYDTVETNNVINHIGNDVEHDYNYNFLMNLNDLSVLTNKISYYRYNYKLCTKLTKSDIMIKALTLYTDNIRYKHDYIFITIAILYYSRSYKMFNTNSAIHYYIDSYKKYNAKTNWRNNNYDNNKYYRISNLLNTVNSKAYNLLLLFYGNNLLTNMCKSCINKPSNKKYTYKDYINDYNNGECIYVINNE